MRSAVTEPHHDHGHPHPILTFVRHLFGLGDRSPSCSQEDSGPRTDRVNHADIRPDRCFERGVGRLAGNRRAGAWAWARLSRSRSRNTRLRGGRREGVDLIVVDNGALRFSVVPTRGMGLWKGWYLGNRLGWDSPISDGPVNPAFVNLDAHGGLGWLEGFDELLARCGLENNGAPFEIETREARRVEEPHHVRAARADRQHSRFVRGRARRRRSRRTRSPSKGTSMRRASSARRSA